MSVTVFKLEVKGGRAARVLKALADSRVTEYQVEQAVHRALDELVGGSAEEDLALAAVEAEAEQSVCSQCELPGGECVCGLTNRED